MSERIEPEMPVAVKQMVAKALVQIDDDQTITEGDCLSVMRSMPAQSVDCVVTSPPYNLGKA